MQQERMRGMNGVTIDAALWQSEFGESKSDAKMTGKKLKAILEQQSYRCALTGVDLTPENASVDHVLPLSRGGEHHPRNAQVILDYVNKAKGSMTQDEFIAMCISVAHHVGLPS
jgi:5-methylcytosine-specific restriction endonuclease McrA